MKWLQGFIKKYPVIQSNYEQQVIEDIGHEKNKLKNKVPEHRWWEIDDIDAMELDLSAEIKDMIRRSELHSEILDIIDSKGVRSPELRLILDDLESVAHTLNNHDKKGMEILIIEGLINTIYSDSEELYDEFYEILGPELKKMCDSNNAFWMKLGEENKKEREARYKKMVEQKQREDAAKKAGNGK